MVVVTNNDEYGRGVKTAYQTIKSLYSYRFRQVARLVHIAATHHGDVVGKDLQRYRGE